MAVRPEMALAGSSSAFFHTPMEILFSKKEIEAYRRKKWRYGTLQVLEEAAEFLDEVGMCLLFACRDIPLPKVYDCASDDADWWAWKDLLQERKQAYNGRLARRKATLVSMELLAAFYALYQTGGGYAMYEEEYYWGKLGELANKIAEHLDRNGPTPVDDLRRAIVPAGKKNTRQFHAALFELQSKFKIAAVGLEDRGWGIRILDLFVNWVPARVEKSADKMDRADAMKKVLLQFILTAGAAPEPTLHRIFGWSSEETSSVAKLLVEAGHLRVGRFRGDRRAWLASLSLRPISKRTP